MTSTIQASCANIFDHIRDKYEHLILGQKELDNKYGKEMIRIWELSDIPRVKINRGRSKLMRVLVGILYNS